MDLSLDQLFKTCLQGHDACHWYLFSWQSLRTHEQSDVRCILKVCKERVCVSAVNTRLQNSDRNNNYNSTVICISLTVLHTSFITASTMAANANRPMPDPGENVFKVHN